FNWSEISSKFGAALDGHSHLPGRPATDDISWYAVVFRSKRREDCNNLDLFEADRLAYDEAFAHTNGALLVYWYTDLDEDNNCLATCVWTSRKHALSVNSLPKHRDAARLSSGAYNATVGWIGLGKMGEAMALNLQAYRSANSLPSIHVYNRTASKCQAAKENGASVSAAPSELAQACSVVFICLANDGAVKSVISEMLESISGEPAADRAPLVIADITTVHPQTTQWVIGQIAERQGSLTRQVEFCQTPVWGAPPAAKAAKLVYVVSGSARSLLEEIAVPAFARKAIDVGQDQVRAAKFKILGNFMVAATIESLGEAMAVADETGIGRELYLEFVREVFPVPPVLGYAEKMVDENGEACKTRVGFTVPGGMKDVGYAVDLARQAGMRLPVAELAYDHLQWVLDNGDADWDWSSLSLALRKEALHALKSEN
ncbi:hypothetical protein GGI12_005622, partial [Dipsacomyces acuminosporus]